MDQLISRFPTVFTEEELPPMEGEAGKPMKIHLRPDAVPFKLCAPRTIPYECRDKAYAELQKLLKTGIIAPVGEEPTKWMHPLIVVRKPDGSVRICVDLTKLNKHVDRIIHPAPTAEDAVARLAQGKPKFFAKFDCRQAYFQMPLDEESQKLTSFVTPWGAYYFCRSPIGFVSTGDVYNYRSDAIFSKFQGMNVVKVVDDISASNATFKGLTETTIWILLACEKFGITLKAAKCVFGKTSIPFLGFRVSNEGISPDLEKLAAIRDFPVPLNRTDLKSFLGLANVRILNASLVLCVYDGLCIQ